LLLEKVIQEELGEVIGGDVVDALQELVEIDKVGSGEMPSRFLCNDVLRPPLNE